MAGSLVHAPRSTAGWTCTGQAAAGRWLPGRVGVGPRLHARGHRPDGVGQQHVPAARQEGHEQRGAHADVLHAAGACVMLAPAAWGPWPAEGRCCHAEGRRPWATQAGRTSALEAAVTQTTLVCHVILNDPQQNVIEHIARLGLQRWTTVVRQGCSAPHGRVRHLRRCARQALVPRDGQLAQHRVEVEIHALADRRAQQRGLQTVEQPAPAGLLQHLLSAHSMVGWRHAACGAGGQDGACRHSAAGRAHEGAACLRRPLWRAGPVSRQVLPLSGLIGARASAMSASVPALRLCASAPFGSASALLLRVAWRVVICTAPAALRTAPASALPFVTALGPERMSSIRTARNADPPSSEDRLL